MAALCAMIMTKHDAATGRRARHSLQVTAGRPSDGQAAGDRADDSDAVCREVEPALAAMVPRTATSGSGTRGMRCSPSRMAAATSVASATVGRLACGSARASCQAWTMVLRGIGGEAEHIAQHGYADLQADAGEEADQDRA